MKEKYGTIEKIVFKFTLGGMLYEKATYFDPGSGFDSLFYSL